MKTKQSRKGFTLTELIIVIAIIAILAAVLVPTITGYIERARRSNALVEMNEMKKMYQRWVVEEDSTQADIYATCDNFVAYVEEMAPNYKNRVNYAVVEGGVTIQTQSYVLLDDSQIDGHIVFLFASTNGLYGTCYVPYTSSSLSNTMESLEVYKDIQEATNIVFSGDKNIETPIDKWEYVVGEKTFSSTPNRYLVTLKNNNDLVTSFYLREGKTLSKKVLDANCVLKKYYVFKNPVEGSYELNGLNVKSDIASWEYRVDNQTIIWDYSKGIESDITLYPTSSAIEYTNVATIERNGGTVYKEYGNSAVKQQVQASAMDYYYFDDLVTALNFAKQYNVQNTYYYYENEASNEYSSIRYENVATAYYDTIKVEARTEEIIIDQDVKLEAGCKLLIPCGDGVYGNNFEAKKYKGNYYDYIGRDPLTIAEPASKVVLDSDVTFQVYGQIEVGAYTTTLDNFVQNEVYVDDKGNGGFGVLENKGEIILNNGATLDSYGFVLGEGKIKTLSGAKVMDMLVIYNWPGGNAAFKSYSKAFVFNSFRISNIRCHTIINYGAKYMMFASVYFPTGPRIIEQPMLLVDDSNDALFSFNGDTNASVEKKYLDGITEIITNGNIKDNNFSIKIILVFQMEITFKNVYFPVYNMNIIVNSGTFNIQANKFMIMPGSKLIVNEGATINFTNNGGIAAMETLTIANDGEKAKMLYKDGKELPAGRIEVYGTITGKGTVTGNIYTTALEKVVTDNLTQTADVKYAGGNLAKNGSIVKESQTINIISIP